MFQVVCSCRLRINNPYKRALNDDNISVIPRCIQEPLNGRSQVQCLLRCIVDIPCNLQYRSSITFVIGHLDFLWPDTSVDAICLVGRPKGLVVTKGRWITRQRTIKALLAETSFASPPRQPSRDSACSSPSPFALSFCSLWPRPLLARRISGSRWEQPTVRSYP